MQVQVETDSHVPNREELARHVTTVVNDAVHRFGDHLTSVQVHLHDDNSPEKAANDDFRCLMEARLSHIKPVAVTQHAANLHQAISGAVHKLERALDSALGKLEDRQRRAIGPGHIAGVEAIDSEAPPVA